MVVVVVVVAVVEAVVVVMAGTSGQLIARSPSVPLEVNVTKPGWLVVICSLIQFWYLDTRAYTPGKLAEAQPSPKLTTPDWTQTEPCLLTKGPPESPCRMKNSLVTCYVSYSAHFSCSSQV